jgi:hypothetical protein
MKRERVEARLMKAMEADILRDFAVIEKVMVDGIETSKVVGVDWDKLRQSDSSVIISEFIFDAETGHLTKFKRDDALNAAAQLRDMWGLKAPAKFSGELNIPKQEPSDWSREELVAVLNAAGEVARGAKK